MNRTTTDTTIFPLLGFCDLCAENGIEVPATEEARLRGGMWANVCEAHAYRLASRAALLAASFRGTK